MTGAGSAAGEEQPSSRMPSEEAGLERGYRWLLVCYPSAHRRAHQEEMLAVLMTAAPEGKRRPGIAESADLIWGALRVRFQPSRNGAEPAWRDALAVLSVIVPVMILLITIVREAQMWLFTPGVPNYGFPLSALQQPALAAAVVALILLRLRRLATLAAAVMVLWVALFSGGATYIWATEEAYLFVPLVLELIALAVSPGPRRGLQILTWKLGAFAVIATLAVAMTGYLGTISYLMTPVVIAVIGAAMVLTSSLGRWLLVLLIIAAWPFLISPFLLAPWQIYLPYGLGFIGQAYVLPAALLAAFTMALRRESRRSSPLPPASQ